MADTAKETQLPSAPEIERCILGAIIIEPKLMAVVAELLLAEDFYLSHHRMVYSAMLELFEASEAIDPVWINERLKQKGQTIEGGSSAITNLSFGLPMWGLDSSDTIRGYCQVVLNKKRVRDLARSCNTIYTEALDMETDALDLLNKAQSTINEICTNGFRQGFNNLGEAALKVADRIEKLRSGEIKSGGVLSGLRALDHVTGGFQKSDLIIIGGRPAQGKSALAGQIALNACGKHEGSVIAIFSLEMSEDQYAQRLVASIAQVDLTKMREGAVNDSELGRIQQAAAGLSQLNLVIQDASSVSAAEMRARLLRLKHERGRLDLVIVDFLQRMVTAKKTENRQNEVSAVARELKSLAKDFNVPVIALASLSRAPEARNPPIPKMSDLRESGDIESEADLVAFVYREFYYNQSAPPTHVQFIIDKHRNGQTKNISLNFMSEFARFSDYEF